MTPLTSVAGYRSQHQPPHNSTCPRSSLTNGQRSTTGSGQRSATPPSVSDTLLDLACKLHHY